MERSSELNFLQTELNAANAQNERLIEENAQLRRELQRLADEERSKSTLNAELKMKTLQLESERALLVDENAQLRQDLQRLTNDDKSKSIVNVETRLKAFQMENERDNLFEQLEKIKRKYNQLHAAFVAKVQRCKALEDVFNRQKTLNGLVIKSAIVQKDKEQNIKSAKRASPKENNATVANLQEHVAKLQNELDEARDIIDELEFELESIDILEMENQRLKDELAAYKKAKLKLRTTANLYPDERDNSEEFDAPPSYSELDDTERCPARSSIASSPAESIAGDMDPETMERAALTDSLIQMAQAESNCLRRELLRSRLRRTVQAPRPTSSDA
ncbi:flagellar attachment zone protein 1 [Musca domestica]|uniref:Flagellar attachment zone protein 1 n=3 Tax=Musca domestica TaxID=7370 RepID=A0ABM3VEN7_MUSDO|nr:flagellar attachment zone protein 1 [Musca domestica]XP_058984258.1 flagellar attachment zone protein 1 [Musca domestica]